MFLYTDCCLYKIKTKKQLIKAIKINNVNLLKQEYVNKSISTYLKLMVSNKYRLIEEPNEELKCIQKNIQKKLRGCKYPEYVFSGVKGRSFVDNARVHADSFYLFSIDISSFFPNISRNKVYNFFRNNMKAEPDVAKILTNICTVDITEDINKNEEIEKFVLNKKIRYTKHICTGSPCSPLLSYLVNKDLFDSIKLFCEQNNIIMSIYMDDMFFSSNRPIPTFMQKHIINLINKSGFDISRKKVKYKKKYEIKKITGVIIDGKGRICIPNKWGRKIIKLLKNKNDNKNKICGLLAVSRQIDKDYMKSINAKNVG